MKIKKVFLLVVCTVLLLTSCSLPVKGVEDNYVNDEIINTDIKEESELFINSFDNTSYQQYTLTTNEQRFLKPNGYTLWTTKFDTKDSPKIKIETSKTSGASNAGYGIVFCRQIIDDKHDFFMTVMINIQGQYCVGKVKDGVFKTIQNWKSSYNLLKGYGIANQIEIKYQESEHKYNILFNEQLESSFSIKEKIKQNQGKYGFVCVISDNENFPSNPVSVSYKKNN